MSAFSPKPPRRPPPQKLKSGPKRKPVRRKSTIAFRASLPTRPPARPSATAAMPPARHANADLLPTGPGQGRRVLDRPAPSPPDNRPGTTNMTDLTPTPTPGLALAEHGVYQHQGKRNTGS